MSTRADNLYLCGFMGAGKSSVGPLLAQRLGWSFLDTDRELEAGVGLSVPQIFAQAGEVAFRELEKSLVDSLSRRHSTVVALGGGALNEGENRVSLMASGKLIHLRAKTQTLVGRLGTSDRPLLQGKDLSETVEKLLAERAPLYAMAPYTVDTDDLSPQEVVDRILEKLSAAAREGAAS